MTKVDVKDAAPIVKVAVDFYFYSVSHVYIKPAWGFVGSKTNVENEVSCGACIL